MYIFVNKLNIHLRTSLCQVCFYTYCELNKQNVAFFFLLTQLLIHVFIYHKHRSDSSGTHRPMCVQLWCIVVHARSDVKISDSDSEF
jgi:hypothetical protein